MNDPKHKESEKGSRAIIPHLQKSGHRFGGEGILLRGEEGSGAMERRN
jgi:hypothetical protein